MTNNLHRCGVLARKVGMSRQFHKDGSSSPVTVLHLDKVQVIGQRKKLKHGYDAVIIGAGKRHRINKPTAGFYVKLNDIEPKQKTVEFPVTEENLLDVGTNLTPEHFKLGQHVDVMGTSMGKGFAGAMKRHNFKGLRASHGVSVSHRSHGSTGNNQDPGRVFKNKKMAGHMGNKRVTIQNLKVLGFENQILLVSGSVPGSDKSWLVVRDSIKKAPIKLESAKQPLVDKSNEKQESQ